MENEQIAQTLNTVQSLITWAVNRGIKREKIQAMLDESTLSGQDISDETVQSELDALAAELDETESMLDRE